MSRLLNPEMLGPFGIPPLEYFRHQAINPTLQRRYIMRRSPNPEIRWFRSTTPTWYESQAAPQKTGLVQTRVINIYPYHPPDRIWGKVFFKVGIKGGGGRAWAEAHALLIIGSPGQKARGKWVIDSLSAMWILSMIHEAKRPSAMWIYA